MTYPKIEYLVTSTDEEMLAISRHRKLERACDVAYAALFQRSVRIYITSSTGNWLVPIQWDLGGKWYLGPWPAGTPAHVIDSVEADSYNAWCEHQVFKGAV